MHALMQLLSFYPNNNIDKKAVVHGDTTKPALEYDNLENEVMTFPETCSLCGAKGVTRMCLTGIIL